jgi:serine/threonine protein kinase
VVAHLSRGRRLDVYDGWSHERRSRVVLKVLRPERADEPKARELLEREGILLRELTHPHLVRAYETLLEPLPIVVLETLGGQTLAHMIEVERRELAPADIAQLGLQLGSAVAYLHRSGFLHLDLKPGNVVAEAGRAKLIDLSLARPPGPAPAGIGTWCYLAPEQARGGMLGPAADVWGLGTVLFEAATLMPVFDEPAPDDGDEPSATLSEEYNSGDETATWASDDRADQDFPQLRERAAPVASLRGLPPPLSGLIDACLEQSPAARPSIDELLARLRALATSFTNLAFG